ncbi:unnamed protein product [Caenorhabditis auriculariae]|uniref:Uncharacterized protein n=1 Tax=Caenorhabditis auriculariae TaxID=2777116 RepID=A0A8S1HB58_9PELO|nr:unnamed protein product [Caenorhabditis auriculariae]
MCGSFSLEGVTVLFFGEVGFSVEKVLVGEEVEALLDELVLVEALIICDVVPLVSMVGPASNFETSTNFAEVDVGRAVFVVVVVSDNVVDVVVVEEGFEEVEDLLVDEDVRVDIETVTGVVDVFEVFVVLE